MPRVKIIAVINQKGGVGKTTTVANLGAALAQSGQRVCLIDLDPQSHLTLHYGIEPGPDTRSVYDLLTGGADLAAVTTQVSEQLSVVSSTIDLAAAEVELVGTVGREQILRDHLRQNPLPYDLVLIDCPPSLGLLTLNALSAADEVVIPLQPHFLALQGLGKLLETVALVQRRINPVLRVSGVILCMYESSTKLSGEVLGDLKNFFAGSRASNQPWSGARIFNTVIRRNIKLAECPSYGTTIFEYEPHSNGAADYRALAEEFLSPAPPQPAPEPAPQSPPENPAAESPAANAMPAEGSSGPANDV
jgi:chromosome partitioning protein